MKKQTRKVWVGNVPIGGGAPVAVQSMTTTDTADVDATVRQILQLQHAGCDIVRVAVPNEACAAALADIKKEVTVPLVADVHFRWDLAEQSVKNGADKLRINPGNMPLGAQTTRLAALCRERNLPVRIGLNGGSFQGEGDEAVLQAMRRYVDYFEKCGFEQLVLAVKSSDVLQTIRCNRALAAAFDYPLHVGLTESGIAEKGIVKSAVAIGSLLADGIGDTIRVSLTDDPVKEVQCAHEILRACGREKNYAEVISCPTCGRCHIDLIPMARAVNEHVKDVRIPLRIAVMGCAVNGPGEAKNADLGMAGGEEKAVFFRHGKVYRTVTENILQEFLGEIDQLLQ